MNPYLLPALGLCFANVIFWYKGNAKEIYGFYWSPFKWWLYTSLFTNYITLYAWWRLIEVGDVWKAGVTWGLFSLTIDLILNTAYYGLNWRGIVALLLCALAALIAHSG